MRPAITRQNPSPRTTAKREYSLDRATRTATRGIGCGGLIIVLFPLACVAGCSVAGTWKRTTVSPADARFPMTLITFDERKQFTATTESEDISRTQVGRYSLSGPRIALFLSGTVEPWLRGQRQWNGQVVLVETSDHGQTRGTFERIAE